MKFEIALIACAALLVVPSLLDNSSAQERQASPAAESPAFDTAVFAGGCFWCVESDFEKLPGVIDAVSGYTGGTVQNPTYQQVSSGSTGHLEAVEVRFDPSKVSYRELVEYFFRHVDPTDDGGQFVDRGKQYSTAVFVKSDAQRAIAEDVKAGLGASGRFPKPIVTPIITAGEFFEAEDYHQNYYQTHPIKYRFYRFRSGRDSYIDKVWKDS